MHVIKKISIPVAKHIVANIKLIVWYNYDDQWSSNQGKLYNNDDHNVCQAGLLKLFWNKTYYYCKGCLCDYHGKRNSSSTTVLNNSSCLLEEYSETILMNVRMSRCHICSKCSLLLHSRHHSDTDSTRLKESIHSISANL